MKGVMYENVGKISILDNSVDKFVEALGPTYQHKGLTTETRIAKYLCDDYIALRKNGQLKKIFIKNDFSLYYGELNAFLSSYAISRDLEDDSKKYYHPYMLSENVASFLLNLKVMMWNKIDSIPDTEINNENKFKLRNKFIYGSDTALEVINFLHTNYRKIQSKTLPPTVSITLSTFNGYELTLSNNEIYKLCSEGLPGDRGIFKRNVVPFGYGGGSEIRGVTSLINYPLLSAMYFLDEFRSDFYEVLKEKYEGEVIKFGVFSASQPNYFAARAHYDSYYYHPPGDYFDIDLSENAKADDSTNKISLMILYSALLDGHHIKISTSESRMDFDDEIVAEFTRSVVLYSESIKLDIFLNQFMLNKPIAYLHKPSRNRYFIPDIDEYYFFNNLFTIVERIDGKAHDEVFRKLKLFRFVDIDSLNSRMAQDEDWMDFYDKYLENDKEMNEELLILFVKAIVKDNDGNPLEFDPEQYYAPGTYTVDSRFRYALILLRDPLVRKYYLKVNPTIVE